MVDWLIRTENGWVIWDLELLIKIIWVLLELMESWLHAIQLQIFVIAFDVNSCKLCKDVEDAEKQASSAKSTVFRHETLLTSLIYVVNQTNEVMVGLY